MYRDSVEVWKEELKEYVCIKREESKSKVALRQKMAYTQKLRDKAYETYLSNLDDKLRTMDKKLRSNCIHPMEYLEASHNSRDVGNEINYSMEYIGDNFHIKCTNCNKDWGFYWDDCYHQKWDDKGVQKIQDNWKRIWKKQRIKKEKEEYEQAERRKYKELKKKYG